MGDKYIVFIDKDTKTIVPVNIDSEYKVTIELFLNKFLNNNIITFEYIDNNYIPRLYSNKTAIIDKIINYSFKREFKSICDIVVFNNIVVFNTDNNIANVSKIYNPVYNKIKSLFKTLEKYIKIKYKSNKKYPNPSINLPFSTIFSNPQIPQPSSLPIQQMPIQQLPPQKISQPTPLPIQQVPNTHVVLKKRK
jgi:hypothetical protein